MKPELITALVSVLVAVCAGAFSIRVALIGRATQTRLAELQATTQARLAELQADLDEQKQKRLGDLARRHEIRKPFLERQLKLYFDAVNLASIISTSISGDERGLALTRFWQIYWGELAVVEGPEVAQAMVDFGDAVLRAENPANLKIAALALAHKCRQSLMELWDVELGVVTAERNAKA